MNVRTTVALAVAAMATAASFVLAGIPLDPGNASETDRPGGHLIVVGTGGPAEAALAQMWDCPERSADS
ncbi:hypothetical protein [Actinoplanes sp. GCM10030250]|uniref:hypothetical protein n=1 Tax=Actinoplanes sp. GCM10030250 TaxID=3273376 RepID=UPI003614573B